MHACRQVGSALNGWWLQGLKLGLRREALDAIDYDLSILERNDAGPIVPRSYFNLIRGRVVWENLVDPKCTSFASIFTVLAKRRGKASTIRNELLLKIKKLLPTIVSACMDAWMHGPKTHVRACMHACSMMSTCCVSRPSSR